MLSQILVTSLAEVWIETGKRKVKVFPSATSLPLRKCGLKLDSQILRQDYQSVTSLAEVWIETWYPSNLVADPSSLPLRKCGLKLASS